MIQITLQPAVSSVGWGCSDFNIISGFCDSDAAALPCRVINVDAIHVLIYTHTWILMG